jgi:arylsulfatase A-like enzyme
MGEYNAVSGRFPPSMPFRSRGALLEHARAALGGHASARPRFAMVHFRGGHADYIGMGDTPRARYADAIAKTLDAAGELVSALPPSTVVVVAGDHGEEFGEHDASTHALSLYEEVLRTPVLVRAPGLRSGSDDRALGCPELVDLVASALADGPPLALGAGPSFAMLASPRGVHGGLSETVSFSMVSGDHVKVIWQPMLDIWELYDLQRDPAERHNIADAQPGQLRTMAQGLLTAIQTCGGGFR